MAYTRQEVVEKIKRESLDLGKSVVAAGDVNLDVDIGKMVICTVCKTSVECAALYFGHFVQ